MTTITIPNNQRVPISRYCAKHISPQRYYLHNSVGGVGWRIIQRIDGWALEAPSEHITIIALKYGIA